MGLKIELSQKLSQSLLMTPQLRQAIELLQLGRQEFKETIEQALIDNPVLEEKVEEDDMKDGAAAKESAEQDSKDQKEEINWDKYLEQASEPRILTGGSGPINNDDHPSLEASLTKSETLREHLAEQLRFKDLDQEGQEIALQILGNLDKYGYLVCTDEELAKASKASVERVRELVQIIQSLDPIGVGARDLGECLWIQLDHQGLADSLAGRIVNNYLDRLEARKYDQIAKAEGVPVEEVYRAVQRILSLDPRPGRMYGDDETRYITPDIYVYKDGDEFVITMNDDGLPKLRISPYYVDMVQNSDKSHPGREYLVERLKAASWLIKSIHQRQQTIYKVTESIVKFQREFLLHGIDQLKPLVLKDVAEDIGMHESTVSRVTTNKYVHTPQGVFELKFFFSSSIKTGDGDVSSACIKQKIKALISQEPPAKPISDQAIVDQLNADGIKIARRTVAKYRESMGIPSSSRRKKLF